jgi:hypothetical protein
MRAPKYGMDGLYSEGLPRLFTSAYQIRRCVERVAPEIVKKLDSLQVNMMTFLPRWLFSIFTTSINNIESPELLLVWNMLFLDGWHAVVRVGVALIVGSKSKILKFESHDDVAIFLCKDLFSSDDLLQIIRAGTMARDAIGDEDLNEYAHEMMGLELPSSQSGKSCCVFHIKTTHINNNLQHSYENKRQRGKGLAEVVCGHYE